MQSNIISFPRQEKAIAFWLAEFETDYFNRRQRSPKTETTWRYDYQQIFRQLPSDQALTVQTLMTTLIATKPDTRTRQRACIVLGALAKFAGLSFNTKPYRGNYSPKQVVRRELPSDSLIAEWFNQISKPDWQWVYGMLATYGLRPHEAFLVDTAQLESGNPVVSVLEGKTGFRRVYPFYPEWFDAFSLNQVRMPSVSGRNNSDLGSRVGSAFHRFEVPFNPYSLRHAWAVRTLLFGLNISTAAKQMGHSVQVHTDIYHRWINDHHYRQEYEVLMSRSSRPLPP